MKQEQRENTIEKDDNRNDLLTRFGRETVLDRYTLKGEGIQDLFARNAHRYSDDAAHAQRIYDYQSLMWFMPSTPILSNGGAGRGMPIACFLNEAEDTMESIISLEVENFWLSAKGGGIGSYWGNVRSIGEGVSNAGKSGGIVPWIVVGNAYSLAVSQGTLRPGSRSYYLPVWHPEIIEFLHIRKPSGDPNRKAFNVHHGIVIDDEFMLAVKEGTEYQLRSPKDDTPLETVDARELWAKILTLRLETGEPYILWVDTVNRNIPEHHRQLGLLVKTSNLCSEITLPTGIDHLGNDRTAVCCLASVNLEYYDQWKEHPTFVEDIMRFLDNVLQDFIDNAPTDMDKARYSAMRERSVGLGAMGFHSYLQSKMVPFESAMARGINNNMFEHLGLKTEEANIALGIERGACPDAAETGSEKRFSNTMAIAPTASISTICGNASPGIEPFAANSYNHKTKSGSYPVRNKYLDKLIIEKLTKRYKDVDLPEETKESRFKEDYDTLWSDITTHEGSVQHLGIFSPDEKDVFKTAPEIDQSWIIQMAADRQPHITQAQSVNLFLPPDIHKRDLHKLHMKAWELGLKSLYYVRSSSIQRAEKSDNMPKVNTEECLGCQ